MKQEKDSEIIATICEYENSVAISDGERLTFRDSSGIIHLKGRGESTCGSEMRLTLPSAAHTAPTMP